MIQNADDAGASHIAFVLDIRDNLKSQKTPSKRVYEQLKGASLLVWNNRSFSKADLNGIKSLGVGSKQTDKQKIGRHGIGVNSVYHFTDAPQCVSDDSVYFLFDPTFQYLPSVRQDAHMLNVPDGETGIRIDRIGQFDGKTAGYMDLSDLLDAFKMPEPFHMKGSTIFRLALRNKVSQSETKISECTFTPQDVERLMIHYLDEEGDCLLFLKNVIMNYIPIKKKNFNLRFFFNSVYCFSRLKKSQCVSIRAKVG